MITDATFRYKTPEKHKKVDFAKKRTEIYNLILEYKKVIKYCDISCGMSCKYYGDKHCLQYKIPELNVNITYDQYIDIYTDNLNNYCVDYYRLLQLQNGVSYDNLISNEDFYSNICLYSYVYTYVYYTSAGEILSKINFEEDDVPAMYYMFQKIWSKKEENKQNNVITSKNYIEDKYSFLYDVWKQLYDMDIDKNGIDIIVIAKAQMVFRTVWNTCSRCQKSYPQSGYPRCKHKLQHVFKSEYIDKTSCEVERFAQELQTWIPRTQVKLASGGFLMF